MSTRRRLLLLFIVLPTLCFAGYGWQSYVDPKVHAIYQVLKGLTERIDRLEARVVELEKVKEAPTR